MDVEMDIYLSNIIRSMNTALLLFALIMAVGISATFFTVVLWPAVAEAAGCPASTPGANASKGRCFRG